MRSKIFLQKGLDKPFRKTRSDLPGRAKSVGRIRHCEERERRSNPHLSCVNMDCFAEPVIGRAFARPVGADPLARNDRKTYPFVIPGHAKREPGISRAPE